MDAAAEREGVGEEGAQPQPADGDEAVPGAEAEVGVGVGAGAGAAAVGDAPARASAPSSPGSAEGLAEDQGLLGQRDGNGEGDGEGDGDGEGSWEGHGEGSGASPAGEEEGAGAGAAGMRGAAYRGYGGAERIEVEEGLPVPRLRSRSGVVVRVHATSVNPVDWKMLGGYLALVQLGGRFPFIPCFDVSGVAVEVGRGCSRIKEGDEVWGMAHYSSCGACAEYVVLPEKLLARKPANLSHVEAAALPLVALTSYQALRSAGLRAEQKVLVLGGSSATGMTGIQIAKHMGARVAATCSTRNVELVRGLGADQVIDYTQEKWSEVLAGEAYDVIYDCVGGLDSWQAAPSILAPRGTFVTIAGDRQDKFTVGKVLSIGGSMMNRKFWSLFGSPHYQFVTCQSNWEDLFEIRKLIEDGALRPVIDKVYPLEDVRAAFEASMGGKAQGKLVIRIAPPSEQGGPSENSGAPSTSDAKDKGIDN